ncbi:MAG: hypothetical protein ABFC24_08285 [Methanoregulaceae archaeon]
MISNLIRKKPQDGKPKNRKKSILSILGAALLLVVTGCGVAVQAEEETFPGEEGGLFSIGNILNLDNLSRDADPVQDEMCGYADVKCYNDKGWWMGNVKAECLTTSYPPLMCEPPNHNAELRACVQTYGNQVFQASRISDCHD